MLWRGGSSPTTAGRGGSRPWVPAGRHPRRRACVGPGRRRRRAPGAAVVERRRATRRPASRWSCVATSHRPRAGAASRPARAPRRSSGRTGHRRAPGPHRLGRRRRPDAPRARAGHAPTRRPRRLRPVVLEVATAAPFGLLWWRKTVEVDPPRVAPRRRRAWVGPCPLPAWSRAHHRRRAPLDSAVQVGEPRGVRPYRPGDPRRCVHWPATAHRGELMVREMERPDRRARAVEVHAARRPRRRRAPGGRAMATVVALVDRARRCSSPRPRTAAAGRDRRRPAQRRAVAWRRAVARAGRGRGAPPVASGAPEWPR